MSNRAIARMATIGIVVVIVVIAAVAGVLALSQSGTSTPTTSSTITTAPTTTPTTSSVATTTTSSPSTMTTNSQSGGTGDTQAVLAQLPNFIAAFNARDASALSNFYTSTAVVNWTGQAQGLQGIYSGKENIAILYGSSIGHTDKLVANDSSVSATASGPNVTVTFTLNLVGHSNVVGNLTAKVTVTQTWVQSGGSWLIQNETWNYLSFTTTNAGSATVFPQWGLALEGKSPNLADEHVLEWNVAPYVAAAIYGSIIAIFALALMVRVRKQKK
jgi:ketosteroid isomerase-like protein